MAFDDPIGIVVWFLHHKKQKCLYGIFFLTIKTFQMHSIYFTTIYKHELTYLQSPKGTKKHEQCRSKHLSLSVDFYGKNIRLPLKLHIMDDTYSIKLGLFCLILPPL